MSLTTQDAVALAVARSFNHDSSAIKDYRHESHSGYRAVHVWLRLPAGRAEVQVRTRLQGQWANAFEALADSVGREIRYGGLPADSDQNQAVLALIGLSTNQLAALEKEGDELGAIGDALLETRELLNSQLIANDEGLTRIEELEARLLALRRDYIKRQGTYHELLVEIERRFRRGRRAP